MSSRHIRGPWVFNTYSEQTAAGDVTVGNESVVLVNKTSGAATGVTLPAAASTGGRRAVLVVDAKGDAATNNITVSVASSGTINGGSTHVISENYGKMLYIDVGDEWQTASPAEISATEIAFLNGVTAGTATASKAVVLDSSKGIATITTATITTLTSTLNITAGRRYSDISTIAATGTVQANAASIANKVQMVSGADNTVGVILPTPTAGDEYFVYSTVATNGLKIYPHSTGTINGGSANAAITIEGQTMAHFIALTTTNWGCIFTANA